MTPVNQVWPGVTVDPWRGHQEVDLAVDRCGVRQLDRPPGTEEGVDDRNRFVEDPGHRRGIEFGQAECGLAAGEAADRFAASLPVATGQSGHVECFEHAVDQQPGPAGIGRVDVEQQS